MAATRAQNPVTWACGWVRSTFGRTGQKALRPSITRTAGRNVSAASIANAIPTAATGPSPRLEFSSESTRVITPRMTVPPEARIASTVPLSVARIASTWYSVRRSSSRKRATSSRE